MGYTTYFTGAFDLDKPLADNHAKYLREFNDTRRMKRDPTLAEKLDDPLRLAVGLPIGQDGEYFVGANLITTGDTSLLGDRSHGQSRDESIIDYNIPPGQIPHTRGGDFNTWYQANEKLKEEGKCQPGLWCQWTVSEDNLHIIHDDGEKFYDYVEWIKYLIEHFLKPWGYKLNGQVDWEGEENADMGRILIKDNKVTVKRARIVYR